MSRPMVIAVRLDGVLSVYDKNRGVEDIGRPIEGAKEFCRWLVEDIKAVLIVVTGRRREDLVRLWLVNNGIQFSKINVNYEDESIWGHSNQVLADAYIGNNYINAVQGSLGLTVGLLTPLIHNFRNKGLADTPMNW
jgi:hypothetical protein